MAMRQLLVHMGHQEQAGNRDALVALGRFGPARCHRRHLGPALKSHPGRANTRRLHGADNASGCPTTCWSEREPERF